MARVESGPTGTVSGITDSKPRTIASNRLPTASDGLLEAHGGDYLSSSYQPTQVRSVLAVAFSLTHAAMVVLRDACSNPALQESIGALRGDCLMSLPRVEAFRQSNRTPSPTDEYCRQGGFEHLQIQLTGMNLEDGTIARAVGKDIAPSRQHIEPVLSDLICSAPDKPPSHVSRAGCAPNPDTVSSTHLAQERIDESRHLGTVRFQSLEMIAELPQAVYRPSGVCGPDPFDFVLKAHSRLPFPTRPSSPIAR